MKVANWSAGLKDGKVRDTSGLLYDINAIISLDGTPKANIIEIKGDDETKTTFVSDQTEDLVIQCNSITFDMLQAITGNNVASSPTGMEIGLGTDSQNNPPFIELQGFSTARSLDGTNVTFKKVWHKVQVTSIVIKQQNNKEVTCELKGVAYQTLTDITGVSLASNRVCTQYIN